MVNHPKTLFFYKKPRSTVGENSSSCSSDARWHSSSPVFPLALWWVPWPPSWWVKGAALGGAEFFGFVELVAWFCRFVVVFLIACLLQRAFPCLCLVFCFIFLKSNSRFKWFADVLKIASKPFQAHHYASASAAGAGADHGANGGSGGGAWEVVASNTGVFVVCWGF